MQVLIHLIGGEEVGPIDLEDDYAGILDADAITPVQSGQQLLLVSGRAIAYLTVAEGDASQPIRRVR